MQDLLFAPLMLIIGRKPLLRDGSCFMWGVLNVLFSYSVFLILCLSFLIPVVTSNCTMGGLPLQEATSALALPGNQSKQNQVSTPSAPAPESKPKKKICCACPETKKLRDECIVEHGEDACAKWIDAHLKCLRAEGFNV